jgi:hypothetical protein
MLQALSHPDVPDATWLAPFVSDFKSRFISLLGGAFKNLSPALALSILNPKMAFSEAEAAAGVAAGVGVARGDGRALSPYDLKRLQVRLNAGDGGGERQPATSGEAAFTASHACTPSRCIVDRTRTRTRTHAYTRPTAATWLTITSSSTSCPPSPASTCRGSCRPHSATARCVCGWVLCLGGERAADRAARAPAWVAPRCLPALATRSLAPSFMRCPRVLTYSLPNTPTRQAAILLTLGLQQREVADLQQELGLPSNQVRQRGPGASLSHLRHLAELIEACKCRSTCILRHTVLVHATKQHTLLPSGAGPIQQGHPQAAQPPQGSKGGSGGPPAATPHTPGCAGGGGSSRWVCVVCEAALFLAHTTSPPPPLNSILNRRAPCPPAG